MLLAAPTLEVVGASRFDAQASRKVHARAMVAVSGALVDDVDHPIGGAPVTVRFASQDGTVLQAWPCDRDARAPPLPLANGSGIVMAGPDGTFCAQTTPPAGRGDTHVSLSWPGTRLVRGAETELTVDASRAAVTLLFDPEPRVVSLGAGTFVWSAVARVADERDGVLAVDGPPDTGGGLTLRLVDERGTALGQATTDAKGSARFVVPEGRLGPPGPGELRLFFDGDAIHAKATRVLACERRAEVTVSPQGAAGAGGKTTPVLVAEESDDGTAVDLDIKSVAGPVPGGSVEGLVDGEVVGAAPISGGRAELTVRWPRDGAPRTHLEARYVPDAPWYVAGSPAAFSLELRKTVPWKRIGVVGAGLVILGWFFFSRSRLLSPVESPVRSRDRRHAESARIERTAEHPPGRARAAWEGRVLDAHDGEAVGGAWVTLERPSFGSIAEVARATTDEAGRFELDATQAQPGDKIIVHGPLHAKVGRPAPAHGILEIALVSRRRAVLRRLVEWAKRRGPPFDASPDPTPAHIRRAAQGDARTASWAGAVEEASFGPLPVDRERETEIDALGHEGEKRQT